jgi:hypothetical protein
MKMADAAIDQAEAVNSNNRVTKVMVLEALQALLQESPGGDGPGYVDVGKRAGLSASTARKWIRRLARDGKLPARYVVPSLHAKKKGLHGDTAQERMAVEANIAEIRQTKEDRAAPAWEVPDLPGWVPTRGWFGEPPAEHSWLVHRADPNVLLDPYPWACGSGPLLVVMCNPLNPWRFLYRVEKYNPGCWYVGPDVFGKYIA